MFTNHKTEKIATERVPQVTAEFKLPGQSIHTKIDMPCMPSFRPRSDARQENQH